MTDPAERPSEGVVDLVKLGSEIAGSAVGAAIGLVGGPAGAIAGAASGPMLVRAFQAATEFAQRQLGHREKVRVGATVAFVIQKIEENRSRGQKVRVDEFFHEQPNERSTAEEIAEGVLLAAQREYEERKLRYYSNLLANIAFRDDIDRGLANALVKQAERMSYRQLCLLALFGQTEQRGNLVQHITNNDVIKFGIVEELYNLFQQGIFKRPAANTPDIDWAIEHVMIEVTTVGTVMYELMELQEISNEELSQIIELLQS